MKARRPATPVACVITLYNPVNYIFDTSDGKHLYTSGEDANMNRASGVNTVFARTSIEHKLHLGTPQENVAN
jgi:ABC-type uncharacterized transport system permease subunit